MRCRIWKRMQCHPRSCSQTRRSRRTSRIKRLSVTYCAHGFTNMFCATRCRLSSWWLMRNPQIVTIKYLVMKPTSITGLSDRCGTPPFFSIQFLWKPCRSSQSIHLVPMFPKQSLSHIELPPPGFHWKPMEIRKGSYLTLHRLCVSGFQLIISLSSDTN